MRYKISQETKSVFHEAVFFFHPVIYDVMAMSSFIYSLEFPELSQIFLTAIKMVVSHLDIYMAHETILTRGSQGSSKIRSVLKKNSMLSKNTA